MRWADGNEGLKEMCDYGALKVHEGWHKGLRFELFGQAEYDFVRDYMDEHHPNVPYSAEWITLKRKEQSQ